MALARKWRPKRFEDLLGQEHVVRALTHALSSGRLHHAYLFTGTRGVGKTTLARILAKCLNCETGVTATPCGDCQACQDIDAGRFSDVLEVDAATNTRVEEMRELLDNAHYLPVTGRFKVYIIDEVHMLSRNAFNAMLKTLEEPPGHMKFILATTDPQKVPVTVLSRCLQFALKPMTVDQLVSRLQFILESEQVNAEPEGLKLIAKAAKGSVRDSLSVLDQAIAFGGGNIKAQGVAELLGVVSDEAVIALAQALAEQDGARLIQGVESLINAGQSADTVLQDFAALMQKCALIQLAAGTPSETEFSAELLALAQSLNVAQVQLCYQIALSGRRDLTLAPDELAGLVMSFLRMLAFIAEESSTSAAVKPSSSPSLNLTAPGLKATNQSRAQSEVAKPSIPVVSMPSLPDRVHASRALPHSREDWMKLVDALPSGGAPAELARHCVWLGRKENRLQLSLPQANKVLLAMTERLAAMLIPLVGVIQLDIQLDHESVDRVAEQSVAARDQAASQASLSEAEKALHQDPVVQALLAAGGRVVADSVKPIKPH
jgi:DNA polymerase III subunit gamma/tau